MISNRAELLSIVQEGIEQSPTITALKSDVTVLKIDVARLKTDVAELKSDVSGVKSELIRIEHKIDTKGRRLEAMIIEQGRHLEGKIQHVENKLQNVEDKIQHWGALYEEMDHNIKLILDAVIPAKRREETITKLAKTSDHHEIRLGAVESDLRTHVADSERHRS